MNEVNDRSVGNECKLRKITLHTYVYCCVNGSVFFPKQIDPESARKMPTSFERKYLFAKERDGSLGSDPRIPQTFGQFRSCVPNLSFRLGRVGSILNPSLVSIVCLDGVNCKCEFQVHG